MNLFLYLSHISLGTTLKKIQKCGVSKKDEWNGGWGGGGGGVAI